MAANRKAIVEQINEGFAQNNLEKVLSFCSDNFTWTMVGDSTVKGKDAIKMAWKQMLETPGPGLTFDTTYVEVARSGDLAYEYGTYDLKTEAKKGKVADEKGKYVVVWKKQANGSWKAVADIYNIGE